jgi:hypothetical protein
MYKSRNIGDIGSDADIDDDHIGMGKIRQRIGTRTVRDEIVLRHLDCRFDGVRADAELRDAVVGRGKDETFSRDGRCIVFRYGTVASGEVCHKAVNVRAVREVGGYLLIYGGVELSYGSARIGQKGHSSLLRIT